jgi:hypothetical protein
MAQDQEKFAWVYVTKTEIRMGNPTHWEQSYADYLSVMHALSRNGVALDAALMRGVTPIDDAKALALAFLNGEDLGTAMLAQYERKERDRDGADSFPDGAF